MGQLIVVQQEIVVQAVMITAPPKPIELDVLTTQLIRCPLHIG